MLTDLALGCWTAASLLDLGAWRRGEVAARRLVGWGLGFVAPTAASGLVEFATIEDQPTRRVAAVHALGNVGGSMLYLASWRARRRGHHVRGAALALLGGSSAIVTGYLGGHLSFVLGAGSGPRGEERQPIALPEHAGNGSAVPVTPSTSGG